MVSFFVFFNEKKIEKDSVDFWHRKMTLKVRIVLFSTFNSKTTERPKIFLWPFSYFFSLAYWPLNSAAGRKKTLVTLLEVLQLTGGSQEGRCICKNQWGILATAVCHACINLHFSMHLQLVILCYVLLLKKRLWRNRSSLDYTYIESELVVQWNLE